MGYAEIPNLYRPEAQLILQFKTVFCLEKIHGTSCKVQWLPVVQVGADPRNELSFFSGGETHEKFVKLFDVEDLSARFQEKFGNTSVSVIGEGYGGRQQRMGETYGPNLKFIAFEVKIGDSWLSVPQAFECATSLGFEFVDWVQIPSDLDLINAERDKPSVQAVRNGILEPRKREGIVIHPPFEVTLNNGQRLLAKHKTDDFKERKTQPAVDSAKLVVLTEATKIAEEWVINERLLHVIDQLITSREDKAVSIKDTGSIIKLMIDDVLREAHGEIVDSKDVRKAIGVKAGELFKKKVTQINV